MSLLLSPGDEILIPNPGYPTFVMTSSLLHGVPVRYPLYPEYDFQPRIEDIEALITPRTRVLILNSPSNPLGAVLGEELTRSLVELARRHDLWIISDECYEAFTYDVPHVSPARFDSDVPGEARVFTSLTLSKTYGLTGLRIGALICPPGLEQQMNNVMESIVSCVASPSQYAALAALTGPQDYVSRAHAHYRANRDAASAVLRSKGIPFLDRAGGLLPVGGRVARQRRGRPGLGPALPGRGRGVLRPGHGLRLHRRGLDPDCALRRPGGPRRRPQPAPGTDRLSRCAEGPIAPTAGTTPHRTLSPTALSRRGVRGSSPEGCIMWWQDLLWGYLERADGVDRADRPRLRGLERVPLLQHGPCRQLV